MEHRTCMLPARFVPLPSTPPASVLQSRRNGPGHSCCSFSLSLLLWRWSTLVAFATLAFSRSSSLSCVVSAGLLSQVEKTFARLFITVNRPWFLSVFSVSPPRRFPFALSHPTIDPPWPGLSGERPRCLLWTIIRRALPPVSQFSSARLSCYPHTQNQRSLGLICLFSIRSLRDLFLLLFVVIVCRSGA